MVMGESDIGQIREIYELLGDELSKNIFSNQIGRAHV